MSWGWRVPFYLLGELVIIGATVLRVSLHETPVFAKVAAAKTVQKPPLGTLLTKHVRVTILGTFIMLATYTLFYIADRLFHDLQHCRRAGRATCACEASMDADDGGGGFGVMVPVAGLLADAFGRRKSSK